MKEKLKRTAYVALAFISVITVILGLCAMMAGPIMFAWNLTFGIMSTPVTYIKVFKIVVGFVVVIGILTQIFPKKDKWTK